MKIANLINSRDSNQLARLVWITFAAILLVIVAFTSYYYWDRYVHVGDKSPVDLGVENLEQLVRENPQDPEARVALAQYYFQNGAYSDSLAQADQVLEAYPDNENAVYVLGMSYVQLGQFEAAIKPLQQFADIRSEGQMANADSTLETALYYLGTSYVHLNQPNEAITALAQALEIIPTDADAMYQLGLAYGQTDQHELAVEQYINAVRFVPDFTEAYHGMVESYTALSRPNYVAYARGMEAFSLKDYEGARPHLEEAIAGLPEFAPAYVGMGLVLEQFGELEEAKTHLERALTLDPGNFLANHALGRVQMLIDENL